MGRDDLIKPISYLKANSADIIREFGDGAAPLIISRNGEAKAVLQDIASYAQMQEAMALLKLLAMSLNDIAAGRTQSVEGLAGRIRDEA